MQPHRSDRDGGRARHALGAGLLLSAIALVGVLLLGRGDPDTGSSASPAFTRMLERCAGSDTCLERETAKLVAAVGAVDVVNAAMDVYRENPRTVPACHTYMHLLGAHLTEKVAAGDAPALNETWIECGAGLVHGAFENIGLDPEDLEGVARVVALCDGRQFSEPLLRNHSCLHAVGHGIHTAVGGDLGRGEELCMRAIPDEASFSRNHPCLAGVYMVDRDERIAALTTPVDVAGWRTLLGHCPLSPRPDVCTSAYFETATRHGRAEAISYLDWCLAAAQDETCLLLLGQGATFRQVFEEQSELDATTCPEAAVERGLDPAPCLEGTRQALAASGTPAETLDDEVCRLLQVRGTTCPTKDR